MKRTKLDDRILPYYTKGDEIFNSVTHMAGGVLGICATVLCVVFAAINGSVYGVIGGAIFGASMTIMYTISAVYHLLNPKLKAKKVMQILDHCTIYFLIAGTYTPILFCSIRAVSPALAWVVFGMEWGCAALGIVFTAIDLKKYGVLSFVCYIGMGWCIIMAGKTALQAIGNTGFWWLLAGGIAYTVGAVLYGVGVKVRYMHSVFHLFCLAGSILQYVCIVGYVL